LERFLEVLFCQCPALCDSAWISSMVSNRCPSSLNFIFGNRKNSHGAKPGKYGGWGMTAYSISPGTAGRGRCSFSEPSWISPQVTYTILNKRVWKVPTSTQLRATGHTDSLDLVVLPCTGAPRYHKCCTDGGTSPEYFGYHLVNAYI
jgi:hypothetical protein